MSDTQNPYAPTSDTNAQVAPGDIPRLVPPQTVRYCYSAELLTAFWTHRTLTSPSDRRLRKRLARSFAGCGFFGAASIVTLALLGALNYWLAVPFALVFLLLMVMGFRFTQPSAVRLQAAQTANRLLEDLPNEHFLSERVVTVDTNGIRQVMRASESLVRWEAIARIEHDDDYAYLFDSSITALVVPRTAFATRGQFLGFVQLAEQLRQAQN